MIVPAEGPARPEQARQVLSLGEAKWGKAMGIRHLMRLRRARVLLTVKGYDTTGTKLACCSGTGFDPALQAQATGGEVLLVDLARLYGLGGAH